MHMAHPPVTRIMLACKKCSHEMVFHVKHRQALAKRLSKMLADVNINDVHRCAKNFICKKCGAKGADAREVERQSHQIKYVGSGHPLAQDLVFHKDTCGWVGHIHKAHVLSFESREFARMSGYYACKVCKP
jgi:hypothetical protein